MISPNPANSIDDSQSSARAIWNERYTQGDIVCTQESVKADPIDYTQHPFLYQHASAKRLTGTLDGEPLRLVGEQFFTPPAKRALAVGVGLAFTEEWLLVCGFVDHFIAYEASEVAVAQVAERMKERGLADRMDVRSGDVTQAGFSDGQFDLVFVQAAIHHFYNIDEMFALFHRVLKPGGQIFYDEYVGPDHHLYDEHVADAMDELNECLAPQFKWDITKNAERQGVPRATMASMMAMDPSEGVHASRILPLTYQYFDVIYRADYGGTFMRPFFVGILPNFDWSDPKDQTIGRLIIKIEAMLQAHGAIPSYHTRVVGRRLDEPRAALTDAQCERITCADWPGQANYGHFTPQPLVSFHTPVNHSDSNWSAGVGILGNAVAFFEATAGAKRAFTVGRDVVLQDASIRQVDRVDLNHEASVLIVSLSGDALDPRTAGYPNSMRVNGA